MARGGIYLRRTLCVYTSNNQLCEKRKLLCAAFLETWTKNESVCSEMLLSVVRNAESLIREKNDTNNEAIEQVKVAKTVEKSRIMNVTHS